MVLVEAWLALALVTLAAWRVGILIHALLRVPAICGYILAG
jgi:hypothetical protein